MDGQAAANMAQEYNMSTPAAAVQAAVISEGHVKGTQTSQMTAAHEDVPPRMSLRLRLLFFLFLVLPPLLLSLLMLLLLLLLKYESSVFHRRQRTLRFLFVLLRLSRLAWLSLLLLLISQLLQVLLLLLLLLLFPSLACLLPSSIMLLS